MAVPVPVAEMARSPLAPRSIAASMARARRRLGPAASDAVMWICIANVWLLFAGLVAVGIGRVAGNEDCLMVEAASKAVSFCDSYFLQAFVIAAMLFIKRVDKYDPDEGQEKGPLSRRAEAALHELRCTFMPGLYAAVPFILLMFAGEALTGGFSEGSREKALGSLILAVGKLGKNVMACFVIIPTVALKVWRVTRPGWQSGSTVKKNP